MGKNVHTFKDVYQTKYINQMFNKYCLPIKYLEETLADLESCGFNILALSDRIFIENYIATNAVSYHTGR
jgi:hypothetical protein